VRVLEGLAESRPLWDRTSSRAAGDGEGARRPPDGGKQQWPPGWRKATDGSTKSRTVPITAFLLSEKWWRYYSAGSARRGALCLPSRGWHGTGTGTAAPARRIACPPMPPGLPASHGGERSLRSTPAPRRVTVRGRRHQLSAEGESSPRLDCAWLMVRCSFPLFGWSGI